MIVTEAFGNRSRGTGVLKHFGTLNIFGYVVNINFCGNHLYGLWISLVLGIATVNYWLALSVLVAYLVGEAKGWGEWVGSLTRIDPWDEQMLQSCYKDNEGKTFPFIHQISNFITPEQILSTFEQRVNQYYRYATLALILRGIYWWLPVYLVLALFGYISYEIALICGIGIGLGFPIAAALGKQITFTRVYNLKFMKLSFSQGWENQEVVYGALQGAVLWYIILGVIH